VAPFGLWKEKSQIKVNTW